MSSTDKSSTFDFSELQKGINKHFEKQLNSLGLSLDAIKKDSEMVLRRKLIVINQAMENHESFGKFGVRFSADVGMMLASNKRESLFEVGILPLLLERYQLILKRLDSFDNKKKQSVDENKDRKVKISNELTRIAKSETDRRLWAFVLVMILVWAGLFYLIQIFGWNTLEPWTYLLGIALIIGSYVYFAVQQREFSPFTLYQHALQSRKKQLFEIFGVDEL